MNTLTNNRLDPSLLKPGELDDLLAALSPTRKPALVDEQGRQTEIPPVLFETMTRVLQMMKRGSAIIMLPEDETFTTQAAANYLGVSRQFLVGLVEAGEIPFHKVGTHRRIVFKDLLDYDHRRNAARRESLRKLSQEVSAAGLYDGESN